MTTTYVQRVADRAVRIDLVRVLLTVLAAPLYLLGFVVGILWLVATWAVAGVATGFDDGRRARVDGDRS